MRSPEEYHNTLIDYLARTYGDDALMVRDGMTYPVYIYPGGEIALDDVLVADYPQTYIDGFAIYDTAHLERLKATRPNLTNGLSYVLDTFSPQTMKVSGKLGYYFDMLATCDALDHELRRWARGDQDSLPLREQFHQQIRPAQTFSSGAGRSAVFGICTLTVFNHDGDYRLVIGQRPHNIGVGAGLYHVYPAFVFQPSGPQAFYAAEWSITHQLYREFGEELFGMPEFAAWENPTSPDYFFEHPAVKDLKAMIDSRHAEIHLTGIAVNPLSTRLEVCTLLVIHDPAWSLRWKKQLEHASMTERQKTVYMSLADLEGRPEEMHIRMTPHGAAAFWLGVERARELLKKR